jgi:hypothetical protein
MVEAAELAALPSSSLVNGSGGLASTGGPPDGLTGPTAAPFARSGGGELGWPASTGR